ncbi:MAG: hypothetical protein H6683_00460 [Deltaproteobacteria bacterium]|nr:hypothetical protein [Deltaproteobacteria bacterium]
MSDYQIEMLWDCRACGRQGILGRYKECPSCGHPLDHKDWYMPGDKSRRSAVQDENLLRHARAGADWRCEYCGSNMRALDGSCENCGAKPPANDNTRNRRPALGRSTIAGDGLRALQSLGRWLTRRTWKFYIFAPICLYMAFLGYRLLFPATGEVTVSGVHWEQKVIIDRWQQLSGGGFEEQKPKTAFHVKTAGKKHHHYKQVLDHYETVHYTVKVTCGTRTETYHESVPCGEDCYTTPEHCSSNDNGFATCTGGDKICSTRYCSEARTREVTKYCDEARSKQEPRYRDVSVPAMSYTWDYWDWKPNRVLVKRGTTTDTVWPTDEEIALNKNLGKGEKERERREAAYEVVFADERNLRHKLPISDPAVFAHYAVGNAYEVELTMSGAPKLPKLNAAGEVIPAK